MIDSLADLAFLHTPLILRTAEVWLHF